MWVQLTLRYTGKKVLVNTDHCAVIREQLEHSVVEMQGGELIVRETGLAGLLLRTEGYYASLLQSGEFNLNKQENK